MSLPASFKAAILTRAGGPLERVTLEADGVAVKITATAINPVDWKLGAAPHLFLGDNLPAILGTDAAGTISAVGSGVSNFSVGERVFFQGRSRDFDTASFQEYARTPAAVVGYTPAHISDEQAAGVSLAGITAAIGLYHTVGAALPAQWDAEGGSAGKGKAIVVLGGSSSVGQYTVQLARLSGLEHIVTNASAPHRESLQKLGAHVVLDRKTHNNAADFLAAVGDDLELALVYDTISSIETQVLAVEILQAAKKVRGDNGHVVCLLLPEEKAVQLGNKTEGGARAVVIKNIIAVGPAKEYRYVSEPFYPNVSKWLASGELVPNKTVVVEGGIASIDDALNKQQAGVSGVKVVVKF
ncbi:chaperonin 10-like protein [Microdochium trichocladiopsis]|uniref:Chaperonin 10-like protein n=1 Tax=Microdochium trichocladiopsis TaxID=1682393 RepID=A0A9P8XT43_9PEZI|nr:chaperonin 10-like protein [Microdochium trichocladiopsis]KAH7016468.1 chaperonin 10-like protein [Microdochium trichocladiopsis]